MTSLSGGRLRTVDPERSDETWEEGSCLGTRSMASATVAAISESQTLRSACARAFLTVAVIAAPVTPKMLRNPKKAVTGADCALANATTITSKTTNAPAPAAR